MAIEAALYIHIPFCRAKCSYCDFFSVPVQAGIPDEFIDALIAELDFRAALFDISGWKSVYVGGGTPSLLSCTQIERLIAAVFFCRTPKNGAEVTIEVNPESLTAEWLTAALHAGVNRFSIGIQSLNNTQLRAVSRPCGKKESLTALQLLSRELPEGGFSADLIAGLPGQSKKSFLNGLSRLISCNPAHISLYTLTLEEHTPLFAAVQNGSADFSSDHADSLWLCGRDFLEKAGYRQYEVSNFARVGFESVHNMVYWQCLPYVGVGPAACGTIFDRRYTNTTDITAWTRLSLAKNPELAEDREFLSKETRIFEFLFMGFRMLRGISASEFEKRFAESPSHYIEPAFSQWKKRGLAHYYCDNGEDFYALNSRGILFLNAFCTEIGSYS